MRQFFTLAAISVFAAVAVPHPVRAQTPEWLTCPDAVRVDPRNDAGRDSRKVRQIAPKAGANTSAELAAFGALSRLAYDLYDVFADGGDLNAAFAQGSDLRLVGFIYGDPGRDTERPAPIRKRRADSRTLYGFVADDLAAGQRLIVFRGTLQPNEWARNLQVRQRPLGPGAPDAHVHGGFLSIFESLLLEREGSAQLLSADLAGLTSGGQTIFVGHSLGSALATLAGVEARRLAPQNASRLRIVTFASPRVGDEGFAALAAGVGRIDRVCNLVDLVTAVPPSGRRTHYTHVGQVFAISSFDWADLNNDIEETGKQIACWHSDSAYTRMLSPVKSTATGDACVK